MTMILILNLITKTTKLMKKIITLMLLLSATMIASAQKMTIKTANGQTVEISCAGGMVPAEVQVDGNKVTFKMNNAKPTMKIDSAKVTNKASKKDTVNLVNDQQTFAGMLANGLAEELSPEYKAFNEAHANDNPKDVLNNLAKGVIGEEGVKTVNFFSTLFSGLRFTKDTTFVAKYEQRKPKPAWRHYDVLELSGSFGRNIEGVSDAMAEKVSEADYGDDTENEHKFGGGIKYSRVYLKGTETDGKWKPNSLGFGWSWGGLVSYSYEQDMGSYFNTMGKIGVQISVSTVFWVVV